MPDDPLQYFRDELQRIVTTHSVMFDKMLFQEKELPIELAELFEDAANTYLDIAERIVAQRPPKKDVFFID